MSILGSQSSWWWSNVNAGITITSIMLGVTLTLRALRHAVPLRLVLIRWLVSKCLFRYNNVVNQWRDITPVSPLCISTFHPQSSYDQLMKLNWHWYQWHHTCRSNFTSMIFELLRPGQLWKFISVSGSKPSEVFQCRNEMWFVCIVVSLDCICCPVGVLHWNEMWIKGYKLAITIQTHKASWSIFRVKASRLGKWESRTAQGYSQSQGPVPVTGFHDVNTHGCRFAHYLSYEAIMDMNWCCPSNHKGGMRQWVCPMAWDNV